MAQPANTALDAIIAQTGAHGNYRGGWMGHCPCDVHKNGDKHPSLSITERDGKILLYCFTSGRKGPELAPYLNLTTADLFDPTTRPVRRGNTITLTELAADKQLPIEFLTTWGLRNAPNGVAIPYCDEEGKVIQRCWREGLRGGDMMRPKGSTTYAYGLDMLPYARQKKTLVFVEGESDTWTCWYHGVPALGIPGAPHAKVIQAQHLRDIDTIYISDEQDQGSPGFISGLLRRLDEIAYQGTVKILTMPFSCKDPNALHKYDAEHFNEHFKMALDNAREALDLDSMTPQERAAHIALSKIRTFDQLHKAVSEAPPLEYAIPAILPEGLCLVSGHPKIGKSTLVLTIALACAGGGCVFNDPSMRVESRDVLYLALEDSDRRIEKRVAKLLMGEACPQRFTVATEWPRLQEGGILALELWLKAHPHGMVVFDVYNRVKDKQSGGRNAYDLDTEAIMPLQNVTRNLPGVVMVIHHNNKGNHDDPLMGVSGSTGLTGGVDTIWTINRQRCEETDVRHAVLNIQGRDVDEEVNIALQGNNTTWQWTHIGNAKEAFMSLQRKAVIVQLQAHGSLSPKELSMLIPEQTHGSLRKLLPEMVRDGLIAVSDTSGRYIISSGNRGNTPHSSNRGNRGNSSPNSEEVLPAVTSNNQAEVTAKMGTIPDENGDQDERCYPVTPVTPILLTSRYPFVGDDLPAKTTLCADCGSSVWQWSRKEEKVIVCARCRPEDLR